MRDPEEGGGVHWAGVKGGEETSLTSVRSLTSVHSLTSVQSHEADEFGKVRRMRWRMRLPCVGVCALCVSMTRYHPRPQDRKSGGEMLEEFNQVLLQELFKFFPGMAQNLKV